MDEHLTTQISFLFRGEVETKNNRPILVCLVRNIGRYEESRTFSRKILKKYDVSKMSLGEISRMCNNLYSQKGYDYLSYAKYRANCYHGYSIEVVFDDRRSGVFFGIKNY